MIGLFVSFLFILLPLSQIYKAEDDIFYDNYFFPLLTIVICKIFLSIYFYIFTKNLDINKIERRIINKILIIISISIIFEILILSKLPNIINVYNNKQIYIFRWCEWIVTIYLIMDISESFGSDNSNNNDNYKLLYKINTICQTLSIIFGFISLFIYFEFFIILSIITNFYVFYIIYKTKNVFLILYQVFTSIIILIFFMYIFDKIDIVSYNISLFICEFFIKGILLILKSSTYILNNKLINDKYINREQVGYIAHDMRIHLNNIQLSLDLLENNNIVRVINTSVKSLIHMMNQILIFNQISNNHIQIEKEYFSIKLLINNLIDEFSLILHQKNINIEYYVNKDLYIYGDKHWIKIFFINLLSNAIKHAKEKIYIHVDFNIINKNETKMSYYLLDDGDGVPEEFISKLFIIFSQHHHSQNSSGLGLYVAKRIILTHDGNINYKYDNGAKFYGSLNINYRLITNNNNSFDSKVININSFSNKIIKKIMIVDDSKLNTVLLNKILMKLDNYKIIIAYNGMEALTLYEENKDIDLIITDYNMPVMAGDELIKKLRLNGYDNNIIMLTGAMSSILLNITNINYILIKPISLNVIKNIFETESIRISNVE